MDWEKKSKVIKCKTYILQETKVYVKTKKGTKDEQYGTYTNYKLKNSHRQRKSKFIYVKLIISKNNKMDL